MSAAEPAQVYTQDEYMAALLERQAEWERTHPSSGPVWLRPLLEWFIRDEDRVLGVTD